LIDWLCVTETITESLKAEKLDEKKAKDKKGEKIEDVANDVDAADKKKKAAAPGKKEEAKKEEAKPEAEKPKGDPPVINGKLEDQVRWRRRCTLN